MLHATSHCWSFTFFCVVLIINISNYLGTNQLIFKLIFIYNHHVWLEFKACQGQLQLGMHASINFNMGTTSTKNQQKRNSYACPREENYPFMKICNPILYKSLHHQFELNSNLRFEFMRLLSTALMQNSF